MNGLQKLNNSITSHIEEVFEHFEYYPRRNSRRYDGPCPIHEGDKHNAFNLYHSGHTSSGNWYCNTQGCHYVFGSSPLGLLKGLLSKNKGWNGFGDKEHIVDDCTAAKFFVETFKVNLDIDTNISESPNVAKHNPNTKNRYNELELLCQIEDVYGKLGKPYYFLNRGFTKEILSKYYIGRCEEYGKPMYMREVIPILDITGKYLVGATGRSINDECKRCGCHHSKTKPCPPVDKQQAYSKWKHSSTNLTHILYNLWWAKDEWMKTRTAIVIESPASVLRMEEAGIKGSVATFGAHLTYEQSLLFKEFCVDRLIIMTDNDKAGESARIQIDWMAKERYNIEHIRLPTEFNDHAEMSIKQLTEFWAAKNSRV